MLDVIINATQGLFSIIFIIAIGYVLEKKGWFDESGGKLLARLVTTVALPLYMITNMTRNFTRDSLVAMAPDLALPVLSVVCAYLIGRVVAAVIKVGDGRRGVFTTNFFIANTMFIGLPVNLALFGEKSLPAVMLYYIVNTVMFWTLGVHLIMQDTEAGRSESAKRGLFSAAALQKLCSPPLMGFAVGIALVLLEIPLPAFLNSGFRYVGSMTTPLSLIFIGIEMSRIPFASIRLDKDMIWSLVGRFIVCPASVLIFLPLVTVTPLSAQVFTIQATMPAMTQMAIVAKSYGADAGYAATLSLLTVLAGIVVIPTYMLLVSTVVSG